jgi:hypothetical protein
MATAPGRLLPWIPRVLGIGLALFLSVFALDAFGPDKTFVQSLPGFVVHLTPALIVLALVLLSWRWELVGGIALIGLSFAYAYWARRHLSWILVVSGSLLNVGLLFLLSWMQRIRSRATS